MPKDQIKKVKRQQEPLTATKNGKERRHLVIMSDSERRGGLLEVGNSVASSGGRTEGKHTTNTNCVYRIVTHCVRVHAVETRCAGSR